MPRNDASSARAFEGGEGEPGCSSRSASGIWPWLHRHIPLCLRSDDRRAYRALADRRHEHSSDKFHFIHLIHQDHSRENPKAIRRCGHIAATEGQRRTRSRCWDAEDRIPRGHHRARCRASDRAVRPHDDQRRREDRDLSLRVAEDRCVRRVAHRGQGRPRVPPVPERLHRRRHRELLRQAQPRDRRDVEGPRHR